MIANGTPKLMASKRNLLVSLFTLALLAAWVLSGCSPAAAPAPAAATEAQVMPSEPPQSTETLAPAATLEPPTATLPPQPTDTALPPTETAAPALGLAPNGISGYCLPSGYSIPIATAPQVMVAPADAHTGTMENAMLNLSIPATSCTLLFTFNQPIPAGSSVHLYDGNGANPWLEAPLAPVQDHPETAAVVISNSAIVAAPYWEAIFQYGLQAADGSVVATGSVRTFRPFPGLCWEGSMPDPVTLSCPVADPKEREPHPDVTIPVKPKED